jgi:hypothetical protein
MRVEDHVVHAPHANSLKQIVNCCRFYEHRTRWNLAPEDHHSHQFDRMLEAGQIGIDETVHHCEQRAGDRRVDCGDDECPQLEPGYVDANHPRRDFAVVQREKGPARRRVIKIERYSCSQQEERAR